MAIGKEDLDRRFRVGTITNNIRGKINDINQHLLAAATLLDSALPDGREKSLAVTKLEEVKHWATEALTRGNAS